MYVKYREIFDTYTRRPRFLVEVLFPFSYRNTSIPDTTSPFFDLFDLFDLFDSHSSSAFHAINHPSCLFVPPTRCFR